MTGVQTCALPISAEAERNHPTEEHLLPLFVAFGAGGGEARRLHASATHAILRMDVYAFGERAEAGASGGKADIDSKRIPAAEEERAKS